MSTKRWTAFLCVALGAQIGGCRLLAIPAPTAAFPPQVHGQLIVYPEFELSNSHRLLREIVAERDYVCETLCLPPTEEPIHVHLYRDDRQFADFVARRYPEMPDRRAFFVETDTRLMVHAVWGDRVAEDLRHEVAHGYLHSSVGNLPLWLDEGLAEYFEVPRSRQGLNQPHLDLLIDLLERGHWQPDLGRLESLTDFAALTQLDYAEAWAWVHMLLNTEPARRELLQAYLRELRIKGTIEPLGVRLGKLHYAPHDNLREHLLELRVQHPRRALVVASDPVRER